MIFLDILAISTFDGIDQAYSINSKWNGGYKQLVFKFGQDTDAWYSCSLEWQNNHYVFGGGNDKRQVSMVNGNRLDRKGTLNIYFYRGACTVLNQITIVLCFDDHWIIRLATHIIFTKQTKTQYNSSLT